MRIKTIYAPLAYGTKCQDGSFPFFPTIISNSRQLGLIIFLEILVYIFITGVMQGEISFIQKYVSKSNSLKAQINMIFTMRVDNSKNFCSHLCLLCIHLCFTHYFNVYSLSNFELTEHQFNNHIPTRGCKSPQQ